MRNPAFLSSHPTGLPSGMTPVIVDQSPELQTRSVFDNHSYQEELELRNELMPKTASSVSNYGIAEIPLRARDPTHDLGSLQYSQGSYDGNAMSATTFDSTRSQSQGLYPDGLTSSRPSTSDESDYPSLMGNYSVKIVEWGPQEGAPGTNVQATVLSPFRINTNRSLGVSFGRVETGSVCAPISDTSPPYRYVVSFQATVQHPSTWAKSKSLPLSLYVPFEGFDQPVTLDLGAFMYSDGGTAPQRPDSGAGLKRRTSSVSYDPRTSAPIPISPDSDMSGRPSKSRYGQLPPIRSGAGVGHTLNTGSYSNSNLSSEYQSHHGSATSSFYQPMISGFSYSSACTPPTPSWTGSASSMTLGSSANTVSLTNDTSVLTGGNPRFVRRRNDQIASISAPGAKSSAAASFNPYNMYPNHKALLRLEGDLSSMTRDWTSREKQDKRRLVHFSRVQNGSAIHANFRPVDADQKEPNLMLISCIWREDRNECYVTSVDTISLLEALVTPDTAFTVEEKNRIRRNLEGFHPETISKQKSQNEEFFKQIMGYPPPRPRHIEKDVKVFKWSTLEVALKKIISKYCASYASTADAPRRQVGDGHYGDGNGSLQTQGLASVGRSGMPTTANYSMVPSHGHHTQQMPLSATSSTFGDYAHGYSQYPPALASRYSQYADQAHYSVHDASSAQNLLQSHGAQQQQQPPPPQQQQQSRQPATAAAVAFSSEWGTPYV